MVCFIYVIIMAVPVGFCPGTYVFSIVVVHGMHPTRLSARCWRWCKIRNGHEI